MATSIQIVVLEVVRQTDEMQSATKKILRQSLPGRRAFLPPRTFLTAGLILDVSIDSHLDLARDDSIRTHPATFERIEIIEACLSLPLLQVFACCWSKICSRNADAKQHSSQESPVVKLIFSLFVCLYILVDRLREFSFETSPDSTSHILAPNLV
jgi:hypothetical protein